MNLRQAQRVLAELVAKCEAAHVELPTDPFDARLRAVQALRHSQTEGKVNLDDALDELQQALGLQPQWQQKLQDDADKRRRRQLASSKRKPKAAAAVRDASPTPKSRTRSLSAASASDDKEAKSRTQVIKERHPAKNAANKELADEFVDLGGRELKLGETQKGISRMKVAKEIRNLDEPVTSGAQTRKLRGVGRSAAAKVDEFLGDGKIHALQELEKEEEEADGGKGDADGSEPDDAAENQPTEEDEGDDQAEEDGDESEYEDEAKAPADEEDGSGDQQV